MLRHPSSHTVFAAILASAAFSAMPAASQPAPSFTASCGELRKEIGKLDRKEEMATIAVTGRLTSVRDDGALVYLFLCAAPNPRVLCVTYETNGFKAGDEVIVTGNFIERGPDHVQLDPCLHHRPEAAR
jgi:hypothetical protein